MNYKNTEVLIFATDYLRAYTEKDYCPIEQAIRRAIPAAKYVAPSYTYVYIDGISYRLPPEVVRVMIALYKPENITTLPMRPLLFKLGDTI